MTVSRHAGNHDVNVQPVLSASEIGEFVFCPQAWHLTRQGALRNSAGVRRLIRGADSHRSIGRRTERIRVLEFTSRLMVALIVAAIVLLVVYSAGIPSTVRP